MAISIVTGPRIMLHGADAIQETPALLARLGIGNVLIVTDPFLTGSPLFERIIAPLKAAGIGYGVFSETVSDPTTGVIEAGLGVLADGGYDGIIGFGGGSPMDTAKAMIILKAARARDGAGVKLRDLKVPASADMDVLPLVCIPTTAGTGSEVTRFTVITDTETDEKMLITGLAAQPLAGIVDYRLTMGKPLRLTADTGIDSITHGLEAYVSRKANPLSDMYAREAMTLLAPNIRTACAEPGNETARAAMMTGATLAGLAFSNASVALVHGMSRPIGAHFHVPHGLSNAMLLPAVTAFSIEAAPARYAEAARIMGFANANDSDEAACMSLIDALKALNTDLQVPGPREYGIEEKRWFELMPLMAEQALASGSPANNPRIPDAAEIVALYEQAWAPNR